MALTPGTRLGVYDITAAIGEGGMGEVYRATDSNLKRSVAIKVLPASVAGDADRLARFQREAEVLAALNHPNIGAIYGLEKTPDFTALVMELVDGEDLSQRIGRGAIPIDEALPIAKQIAEALEAAHEQGIIHRDLKPANIRLRPDGTVKILDFGLAKAMDPAGASTAGAMNSPTLSIHPTQAGIILGTAAYMAPEQARGRVVDKRADLWAFGCVLFEMLTGKRAFGGDDVTDIIVSVVSKEPDWTALPPGTPPSLERLLRRSLEKDPKRRLDSAAAARLEIDDALSPAVASRAHVLPEHRATTPATRPARAAWTVALPWAIAAVAIAAAGAVAWRSAEVRPPSTPVYASLDAPAGYVLGEDDAIVALPTRTPMVFTPDGRALVIQAAKAGKPQLFLRPLDRPDLRPIAGTEDARAPFVSPDGKWIGFWTADELRKVPLEGGAATTICTTRGTLGPFGAVWGAGDVIVFGDDSSTRLMRVSASGGTPVPVTPQPETFHRHVTPVFLPDGKRVLFTDVSMFDTSDTKVMVQAIDGGQPRLVLAAAADPRLLPSGRLAFMRLGTLMTAPFDAARAEVAGDAVAAFGTVMQSGLRARVGADTSTAGMFAVSSLGALAIIRGPVLGSRDNPLVWIDRDGRVTPGEPAAGAPPGGRLWMRISPDGSRVSLAVQTPIRRDVWILDRARDLWTACDGCAHGFGAVWSGDGRRLAISKNSTIVVHAIDGSAPDQELVREEGRILVPVQWLSDGQLLYESTPDMARIEVKVFDPNRHVAALILPAGSGSEPEVSPDGRSMAYTSFEGGQAVVMVQAFPGPGAKTQVSGASGTNAKWSSDGRTLYYLGRDATDAAASLVMAVNFHGGSTLEPDKPRELFRRPESQRCVFVRCYDLQPDGSRFLFRDRANVAHESVSRMDLVLNWTLTLPAK